jgi:hypothetical protein
LTGVVDVCTKQRRTRVSASQGVEVEIIDVPFKTRNSNSTFETLSAQEDEWIGPANKSNEVGLKKNGFANTI